MPIIEDGTGTGNKAKITNENKLETDSVMRTMERHANEDESGAYHLLFNKTPTTTNDCFLYMKNTNSKRVIIEGIWFRVASAEQILIKLGDTGTASGGTDIIPVNCHAGSSNTATGTFQEGVDITGLSGGSTVEKYWLTSTETKHYNFEQDIIIPKNQTFTLYAVTGAVAVSGTVVFNYHGDV